MLNFGLLPEAMFSNPTGLTELPFQHCGVSGIIPAAFSCRVDLQVLEVMCLKQPDVRPQLDLPPELSRCSELSSLSISTASISPRLWEFSVLQALTLDQCSPAGSRPAAVQRAQVFGAAPLGEQRR